jgi:hypothetical protein
MRRACGSWNPQENVMRKSLLLSTTLIALGASPAFAEDAANPLNA